MDWLRFLHVVAVFVVISVLASMVTGSAVEQEPSAKVLYEEANELWHLGDYAGAAGIYEEIISDHQFSASYELARLWLIGCHFHLGDEARAHKMLAALVSDSVDDDGLAGHLYDLGNSCWSRGKYSSSREVYQQIVHHCPDSEYYFWARVWTAGADYWLGNGSQAHEEVEALCREFVEHPLLPKALRQLGDSVYSRFDYSEADRLYGKVIALASDETEVKAAKVKSAACQYYLGGQAALEKNVQQLVSRYAGDSAITEGLYRVAKELESTQNHAEARDLFRVIIANCQDSEWLVLAEFHAVGCDLFLGDIADEKSRVDSLLTQYAGAAKLAEAAYDLANRYWALRRYDKTLHLYQHIIDKGLSPDKYAILAHVWAAASEVRAGDYRTVDSRIEHILSAFSADPELPELLYKLCEQYYERSVSLDAGESSSEMKMLSCRIGELSERIAVLFPDSDVLAAGHFLAAECQRKAGDHLSAVAHYEASVRNDPTRIHAWHSQLMVGKCYERLVRKGQITANEADPLIRDAYSVLLQRHPDCRGRSVAEKWMSRNPVAGGTATR